ncbi:hypothetical protein H310_03364 [Aphanomyces invadans]|uniref:C2 domain-containing protein n=1 Tax=Aphanomyces invadans TaxID=157072 RepID=A0A024UJ35_9STRA|nr:hypothetical protein H310_03364 [Aphanomyces invadans]ETW05638.1 hypothetical protein H310_03364 [Aphanomyces invadans]|eukprot:XP_008865415.1 hypothetical protein H310_03364 [Aphanomyces invadans]
MATVGKGDLLRENQQLCFPIHVPRDVFRRYLDDMAQLRFDVVDKLSHRVYGQAAIPIRLDELEEVDGLRRDINVVKCDGIPGDVGGSLTLYATAVWSDAVNILQGLQPPLPVPLPKQISRPMHRLESDVRVWKNKDFPENKQFYLAQPTGTTPTAPPTSIVKPPNTALSTLLQKGEALRRSMQRAMEQHENDNNISDIPAILASAKSFGPVDLSLTTSESLRTNRATPMYTCGLPICDANRPHPSSPSPLLDQGMVDTPMEMLLRVDLLRVQGSSVQGLCSVNVYVTHKALQPTTKEYISMPKRVRITMDPRVSAVVALEHQAVFPCVLTPALVHVFDTHQIVVEVRVQTPCDSPAHLLGLAKIPLKPFAHAFRNKTAVDSQISHRDPYVGVPNTLLPVKNPFTGTVVGSITCTTALGTTHQIASFRARHVGARKIQAWWKGRCAFRRYQAQLVNVYKPLLSPVPRPTTEPSSDEKGLDDAMVTTVADGTIVEKDQARVAAATRRIQRVYRHWKQQRSHKNDSAMLDWSDVTHEPASPDEEAMPTLTFDIDEDTIKLLNDPVSMHSMDAGDAGSISMQDSILKGSLQPTRVDPSSGTSWRLMMELAQQCPQPGGIELRYVFYNTEFTLWWDHSSSLLSTRNYHTYDDSHHLHPVVLFEMSSLQHGQLGHATLHVTNLASSVAVVWIPVTWTHPTLDPIQSLPLRIQHTNDKTLAITTVTSTKLLPATSIIRTQVTSMHMLDTQVNEWQVFFKFIMEVGVELHPNTTTVEFDTTLRQYVSYQASPTVALTSERLAFLAQFDEYVVISPALLESMQDRGVTIQVYRHVVDMDILIGTVSVPLASLLYRTEGIRGIFPFQERDGVHNNGRLGVTVQFLHHNVDSTNPTRPAPRVSVDHPSTLKDFHVTSTLPVEIPAGQSIHDIDFLLDETSSESAMIDSPSHYTLSVSIEEARNLHTATLSSRLPNVNASFQWGPTRFETSVAEATRNPIWMAQFQLDAMMPEMTSDLVIQVWDRPSSATTTLVGQASIDLALLKWTKEICGWYHLMDTTGNAQGQLKVRIQNSGVPGPQRQTPSTPAEQVDNHDDEVEKISILKLLVKNLTDLDASLTERHLEENSDFTSILAQHESATSRAKDADSNDATIVTSMSALPSPTVEVHAATCLALDVAQEYESCTPVHVDTLPMSKDEETDDGQSTWDNGDFDVNALEIYGSHRSDSGEDLPSATPPQSPTTLKHEDHKDAFTMEPNSTPDGNSDARDSDAFHTRDTIYSVPTALPSPRQERATCSAELKSTCGDPEEVCSDSQTSAPTTAPQGQVSSHWTDDGDEPFNLNDLNVHIQPSVNDSASANCVDRAHACGRSRMDIHELDALPVSFSHDIPDLPANGSMTPVNHPVLYQVLEVMHGLQSQISSLVHQNEAMAVKIAQIPLLVAESCSDRLTASHASLSDLRDTSASVCVPTSDVPRDTIHRAIQIDASTQSEVPEIAVPPIHDEPRPIQQITPRQVCEPTEEQKFCPVPLASDGVRSNHHFNPNTKLPDLHEHGDTNHVKVVSEALDNSDHQGGQPQFIRNLDRSVTAYMSPPSAAMYASTSNAPPGVLRTDLFSSRRWTGLGDDNEPCIRLPHAFRFTNRMDGDQPKPTARALFDSETERIAKIMCGNLQQWLDHDSSSDDDDS